MTEVVEYPPEKPWEPASCGRPAVPRSGTGDDFNDSESDPGSSTGSEGSSGQRLGAGGAGAGGAGGAPVADSASGMYPGS